MGITVAALIAASCPVSSWEELVPWKRTLVDFWRNRKKVGALQWGTWILTA